MRSIATTTCALACALTLSAPANASPTYYQGQTLSEKTNRVLTATANGVTYSVANGSHAQQWDVVQAAGRPTGQVNYVNRDSGLCMDVDKSGPSQGFTVGARVIMRSCTGTLSQVWELRKDWDPFFKKAYALENKLSLLSLTVKDGSESNGAELIQDDLLGGWGGTHQFWFVAPVA
ncbi:RICIN domain-containing protein [Streptomyces sp. NPDC099088]|uniref:RICIN domain-containing protein n=1 Tax=Streptomyces sp. NPDC099088 TaxID=3366101 RepID=UPI003818F655